MSGEQAAANLNKANALKYVRLNVGGSLFYTTVATLTNPKHDTMLRAMFSGRMEVQTDAEGK
jgi:BTB/POZ domain-containing adapter for CUL3-mediated RhoA degradation protein